MRIHPQTTRNLFSLINMACALAHHIDFLQSDNVGRGRGNDIGNARRRNAPINAKATMHIPCQKAKWAQGVMSCEARQHSIPPLFGKLQVLNAQFTGSAPSRDTRSGSGLPMKKGRRPSRQRP
jgi:hypothetical protein